MRPGESNVGGTLLVQKCLFHRKINANIIVTLRRGLHSISGLASAAPVEERSLPAEDFFMWEV